MESEDKKDLTKAVKEKVQPYINRILKGADLADVMLGCIDAEVEIKILRDGNKITEDEYIQAIALISSAKEKRLSELGLSKKDEDAISYTEALKDVAAVKRSSAENKGNDETSESNIPDPSKSGSRGGRSSGPD